MNDRVILCLICAYDIANVGSIKVSVRDVDTLLMKEFQKSKRKVPHKFIHNKCTSKFTSF